MSWSRYGQNWKSEFSPEAIGLWLEGTMQPIITRLAVRQALDGVYLTWRSRNVIVDQCHLYHNRGVGLFLDQLDLHQVNVTNCHVSYNGGGGIVVRGRNIRKMRQNARKSQPEALARAQLVTGMTLLPTYASGGDGDGDGARLHNFQKRRGRGA